MTIAVGFVTFAVGVNLLRHLASLLSFRHCVKVKIPVKKTTMMRMQYHLTASSVSQPRCFGLPLASTWVQSR